MSFTTKRHPSLTRHKTAVSKDGKLLGMDIEFNLDGGAYATLSQVVLARGSIHATGPYACPNVRVQGKVFATNHPPSGAFRGFGVPQSAFAVEKHLDGIASKLGISPEELRRINFLKEGDTTATGQIIREKVKLPELIDAALVASDYRSKKEQFKLHNSDPKNRITKGIGISASFHGGGFTGVGEQFLASLATVEAQENGQVKVLVSSTEIGQGSRTVLAQIAAESLGIKIEDVEVLRPDTALVPNSGPTVASRTTMIVGKLVERASKQLRQELSRSSQVNSQINSQATSPAVFPRRVSAQYEPPPLIHWDDKKMKGDAYGTFAWSVNIAEVSVDNLTYEIRVDRYTAAQEVGTVMQPVLAKGQVEGGVVQGIGFALFEKVAWKDGQMQNPGFTDYIIPTSEDVPEIEVIFLENPYAHGPSGAKGLGELPLNGVAPAIVNAVESATGISISSLPLLPEDLQRESTKREK